MPVIAAIARRGPAIAGIAHAGLAALAGCSERSAACGAHEAIVERVVDGDTIVVSGGVRVRYLLVDAPENTNGHDECYGPSATRFNADLVLGKTVELEYDVECRDVFDRTLAYVTVDGQDVNQLLVERGYACVLHIPPDGDARVAEFEALESAARAARRGLWGACDPIPCR